MKYLLIWALIFQTATAFAGLPPTSSKGDADAAAVTTFNFQFPGFGVTHTGTTVAISAGSGVAVGDKVITAAASCPAGTLPEDGAAVSRTTYAGLFTAISTTYGVGDGSTTFNVPNSKGVFERGAGSQTIGGITYTGTRGTSQGDQFQGHYHDFYMAGTAAGGTGVFAGGSGPSSPGIYQMTSGDWVRNAITNGTNGTPRTGSETQPANISHLHCIRYVAAGVVTTPVATQPGMTIASSLTAAAGQGMYFCNATSGNVVVTLPQISTLGSSNLSHQVFCLKKTDASANTCQFAANASDTIDGATTNTITAQYTSRCIIDNAGTSWYVR